MASATSSMADLLGQSPEMAAIREQVARLLRRQAEAGRLPPILIEGETGTGKGLLARLIHRRSIRAAAPFVDINCAAIPENLLEAELFGFERGAFTDARHAKPGLFQAAHRGVLFLDEVGLLPDVIQGKVLKVIEERVVRRLGSVQADPTDIWIIAATSDDLPSSTRARRFREDLYHRLAALTLRLPPLRDRGGDVVLLAEHFLARACVDYRLPTKTLDEAARQALLHYPWPGNVRELSNVMERVALLSDDRSVTAGALDLLGRASTAHPSDERTELAPLREAVGDVERRRIVQILTETGWNVSRAAARLGIPRSSLRYRLEKYGLQPSSAGPLPSDAGVRPFEAAEPRDTAGASGVHPIDWQDRHLTFLQVTLASEIDEEPSGRAQRLLHTVLGKVQILGGRLEEQGATGFVAVFGLEPVEDASTRAAHAALAVQNAVQRAREADPLAPTLICALHAGHLLAGVGGIRVVIDMHARHRARAVLEALSTSAEDRTVLVSETAAPLLERRFQLEPVSEPVAGAGHVYRLVAREPTGYGLAGRPLTPFVGRACEMTLLDGVRARVTAGHGQVVALVGEPGVGKSRITYELARAASERGWLALEGHAASYGAATAYLPLIDLLRRYFRLDDADGPPAAQDKVRSRLAGFPDRGLPTIIPALLAILGGPVEDDEWRRLEPSQRRERILDGVKHMLLRESHVQPLLVLFEDLHWIDAETQAFLDRLVETLPTARVLLLVNYRPEFRHDWGSKTYYRQLQIDPLPPESSGALLDALLGSDAALDHVKQLVIERTEGNPFFIEESVRSLVETGVLAGERGAYRVTRVVQSLQVPATAQALLAARIDRLPSEDKRLLQVASVVGKDVPLALLQVIADLPDEALRRGLDRLQAAEFLYETGLYPDPEYSFKHALTHEVTYSGVQRARRRELHARIVHALETLQRDRLGDQIERLAHHALRGELREKAVDYLRRAGLEAAARSAPQEARVRFEQALEILETLPEGQSTLEQAFEIRLELRPVMQQLGEAQRMLERLREAEALAERLNDDRRRGRVCALATNDHSRLGELDEALATGARALEIAGRLGDVGLRILTTSFLGQAHYYRGEYERAVELATDNLAALPADWVYEHLGNSAPASVYDRACLVRCLAELGRFAEAARHEAEAIRIAESTRHAFTIAAAHWAAGTCHLLKGDWEKARSLIEYEMAVVQAGNLVYLLPFVVAALAWVLAQLGDAGEALTRCREGEELLEHHAARGILSGRSWVYHSLGRACLLLGRLDEARRLAERAVETAPSQRGFTAHALWLLGETASHPDQFDAETGEAYFRQALALAEPRGMRPLVAHCHRGLGELYHRTDERKQAEGRLATAAAMYREMGMTYWLRRAEADLRE
jgi:DNA-binding NtrC family response regulator/tetratricopeptide (TPR) repeat protein